MGTSGGRDSERAVLAVALAAHEGRMCGSAPADASQRSPVMLTSALLKMVSTENRGDIPAPTPKERPTSMPKEAVRGGGKTHLPIGKKLGGRRPGWTS